MAISTIGTSSISGLGYGFKNRLLNGSMMIDQRNAGAAITPTSGVYTADRWGTSLAQASKLTFQQVTDAPAGYKNSLKVTVASQYSPISTDYFGLYQQIEGLNVVDLSFGSAGAVTVTLSAQVKSSIVGTYSVRLANASSNRSYVGTYTISATGTWTPLAITIAGDQSGTWATDNTTGIQVFFDLGSGSNFQGTAGSWQSANYTRTSGSVTFVNQANSSTWQITGVQLEKGSTATSFDYRPYGTELALCQRYCEVIKPASTYSIFGTGNSNSTTAAGVYVPWQTTKRTNPTITFSATSDFGFSNAVWNSVIQATSLTTYYQGLQGTWVAGTVASGLTTNAGTSLNANNNNNAAITISAEL